MIGGRVTAADQAVLDLAIFGPSGHHQTLTVLLDTGFNGYLTLPPALIAELDLPYHSVAVATVAGALSLAARRFTGEVVWDGATRTVIVLEAEGPPLVGIAMLRGFRLTMDVLIDGQLTIQRLG